jgi:threonine dehydrogenase-like Zn-dependent dehydrogenase
MKALRFQNQSISMVEVPIPEVPEDEALVKVLMAGICSTDLELLDGYQDFEGIAGHEFVGLVAQAPQAPRLIGKRVAADITVGCGECRRCLGGDPRHCRSRQAIGIRSRDGAFAQYVAVPVANLVPIPDRLETAAAAFAEPLAAALEIAQQVHVRSDTLAAVLGDGCMGQLCARALNLYCRHIAMFGRHAKKLAIAAECGIQTHNMALRSGREALERRQRTFDLVVEATGNPEAIDQALALVRPEGTVVVKTTSRRCAPMDLASLVVNEITMLGSRCGDVGFAVKRLADGSVFTGPLVEAVYPFSDFKAAFDRARTRGSRKVLVSFERPAPDASRISKDSGGGSAGKQGPS